MNYLKRKAENLFPAYFALVMTSGALSIGTHLLGMYIISKILLMINVIAYVTLWLLTIVRLLYYYPKLIGDITSHEKGPGFLTLVAGTCVFGRQIIKITNNISIAVGRWIVWVVFLLIVMYTFFFFFFISFIKSILTDGGVV